MRVIFIHGLGEKPSIFDKIQQGLNIDKLFIDHWEELGNTERIAYKAIDYAKDLVLKYNIQSSDIIIGHSLGGWMAYHIKYLVDCKAIQIASWTDMDRVRFPISNFKIIAWMVKRGLTFNPISRAYFIRKQYRDLASKDIFIENYNRLMSGHKINVLNQLNLILHGSDIEDMPEPDLRIHSKADRLIRSPKQDFYEVPGDHFNLHTHPEEVLAAIRKTIPAI